LDRLLWRHVGRTEVLDQLLETAGSFLAGGKAKGVWLHGPPGCGRTHLMSVLAARLRGASTAAQVPVVRISEDLPGHRSVEALLARIAVETDSAGWEHWPGAAAPSEALSGRRVLLFDGFDRQLRSLGTSGRKALKKALAGDTWIVATGDSVPDELTRPTEAWRNRFTVVPLSPLTDFQANELLDRTGPEDPAHLGRRQSLVTLAGGMPRTLVALSQEVFNDPDASAAEYLSWVLDGWTPEFRLRFRCLSSQAQRVLERISEAPRALTPTELARHMGRSPSAISVLCNRLVDDGVLARESRGRNSLYKVVDPLFRFWIESRGTPFDRSRVALVASLLETAGNAPKRQGEPQPALSTDWQDLLRDLEPHLLDGDLERARNGLRQAKEMGASADIALRLACALPDTRAGKLPMLGPLVVHSGDAALRAILDFALALRQGPDALVDAFERMVDVLADQLGEMEVIGQADPAFYLRWLHLARLVMAVLGSAKLPDEPFVGLDAQEQLGRLPYLRTLFARRGWAADGPPLLSREAVIPWTPPGSDPSLDELVSTFHLRGDATRCAAALALCRRYTGCLPVCTNPVLPAPGGADLIASIAGPDGHGLQWAASFADADPGLFAAMLVRYVDTPGTGELPQATLLAVTTLSTRSPERTEALLAALGADHDLLRNTVERLQAQFEASGDGPLHGELLRLEAVLHGA
jgi:DNA-binding MarR family transcriptional regulator